MICAVCNTKLIPHKFIVKCVRKIQLISCCSLYQFNITDIMASHTHIQSRNRHAISKAGCIINLTIAMDAAMIYAMRILQLFVNKIKIVLIFYVHAPLYTYLNSHPCIHICETRTVCTFHSENAIHSFIHYFYTHILFFTNLL